MQLASFLADAGQLLALPSTSERPEELRRALEFVVDFVGPGFTVERFESNGRPSALLYRAARRPRFRVILNAHLDVVPGLPGQFQPRREGDRLYARGAQDMKVTALAQARVFRELAAVLPYPLGLQLVTDEEIGGRDGTLHQLGQGVAGDFVVIGEQSGLRIVTESKGIITVRLLAEGRGGHGAYPWLGDNALVAVVCSVHRLLEAYPVPTAEVWRTTVNLARIETANGSFNQIPVEAQACLDIRFPPEDADFSGRSVDQVAVHLRAFCHPGVRVECGHLDPPHRADPASVEVRILEQAVRDQGFAPDFLRKHGAADGRFYSQRGIDAVIFGIGGAGQHGPEEYADITTILPYYRALTGFLIRLGEHSPL